MEHYQPIRIPEAGAAAVAGAVRVHAVVRGALIAAAVIFVAVLAARWTIGVPVALMLLAGVALVVARRDCLEPVPLRRVPPPARSRYIEERAPALDDRLGRRSRSQAKTRALPTR